MSLSVGLRDNNSWLDFEKEQTSGNFASSCMGTASIENHHEDDDDDHDQPAGELIIIF